MHLQSISYQKATPPSLHPCAGSEVEVVRWSLQLTVEERPTYIYLLADIAGRCSCLSQSLHTQVRPRQCTYILHNGRQSTKDHAGRACPQNGTVCPPQLRSSVMDADTHREHYVVQNIPVPSPQEYEVLLKIGAAGFCHTDAMVMDGSFDGLPAEGVTGSHEPAGTIVALGPDAEKEGQVKVGQRVAAMLQRNVCRRSLPTRTGRYWELIRRNVPGLQAQEFRVSSVLPIGGAELSGRYCPNCDYGGIMVDGFFAEYALVDSRLCATLPDSLSFEQVSRCLTCTVVW